MSSTMTKLKTYIAGPMRGKPDFNRDSFYKAEKKLNKLSCYDTYNPARADSELDMSDEELVSKRGLRAVMKRDLNALLDCDIIYMLRGWEKSEGATIEHRLAAMLSMTILYE